MIEEFISTWDLFAQSYVSAWLIALFLPVLGVLLVARDQIFLGAAVSQASTLGVALSFWIAARSEAAEWTRSALVQSGLPAALSVIAVLLTMPEGRRRETHEALTGWVFLVSASFSVLLVAHSPHGLEEVHKLLFSTVLGATWRDAAVLAALALLIFAPLACLHRPLVLLAIDPAMARAVGIPTRAWSLAVAIILGLAIGWSLEVAGLLYTFGCLILPPLIARNVVREVRSAFVAAPLIGAGAAVAGSVLAHRHEYPPAQLTVALLATLLAVAWIVGSVLERFRS